MKYMRSITLPKTNTCSYMSSIRNLKPLFILQSVTQTEGEAGAPSCWRREHCHFKHRRKCQPHPEADQRELRGQEEEATFPRLWLSCQSAPDIYLFSAFPPHPICTQHAAQSPHPWPCTNPASYFTLSVRNLERSQE